MSDDIERAMRVAGMASGMWMVGDPKAIDETLDAIVSVLGVLAMLSPDPAAAIATVSAKASKLTDSDLRL